MIFNIILGFIIYVSPFMDLAIFIILFMIYLKIKVK